MTLETKTINLVMRSVEISELVEGEKYLIHNFELGYHQALCVWAPNTERLKFDIDSFALVNPESVFIHTVREVKKPLPKGRLQIARFRQKGEIK